MTARMQALAVRRQALVAQAFVQRSDLLGEFGGWEHRLALADRGFRVVRFVRAHPLIVIVGVTAVAVIWPTRIGVWMKRGWFAGRWIYGPLLG